MSIDISPTTILNNVAKSLVISQRYANVEDALWQLALSAIRTKIAYYRRRIRSLEQRYTTDFDTFTEHLKEQATLAEEDDWLAWRSAHSMLTDWQQAYQDLLNEHPR